MRIKSTIMAALFALSALAAQAAVGGKYTVDGTNPGGKGQYKGTLTITPHGELYRLQWTVGASYSGIGILKDNALAVGWGDPGKANHNVVVYTVQSDGTLKGLWATADGNATGTETATPAAPAK